MIFYLYLLGKDDAREDVVQGIENSIVVVVVVQDEASSSAGQDGPDSHPQVAQLLRRRPQEGHPGHVRPRLQQEFDRIRQLRSPLLRKGIQHAGK